MISAIRDVGRYENGRKEKTQKPVGMQLMEYLQRRKEGRKAGETDEEYGNRVCAKARSGRKLTAEEMSYLARTNPGLYRQALRAQRMRKALENRLESCKSKEEAQEVFYDAVIRISKEDPDRDMIIAALRDAFKEFKESTEYKSLPEKSKEEEEKEKQNREQNEENRADDVEFRVNGCGYQEAYVKEESGAAPVSLQL